MIYTTPEIKYINVSPPLAVLLTLSFAIVARTLQNVKKHFWSLQFSCHCPNLVAIFFPATRGVGSIKKLGWGGTGFEGHFWNEKAPKKFFPEMLVDTNRETVFYCDRTKKSCVKAFSVSHACICL
jgi:hypothetical protein